jgi:hypothetical protein
MTDDEFAKELQAGMANLLGDTETSVCPHVLRAAS